MRRAIDFLAPLGLVVIIGSAAWERSGRTLPGKPDFYLIAGAALILWNTVGHRRARVEPKAHLLTR